MSPFPTWPAKPLAVAPSILAADFGSIRTETEAAEAAGADFIHLDVMDGHFVPNISFGPAMVEAVRRSTRLLLDVHLMIAPPEPMIDAFVAAGADGITVHVEATVHLDRLLERIARAGVRPGVAINPATPAATIAPVLHRLAMVNVMTVNPGFGGQAYLPNADNKVADIKSLVAGRDIRVEVDGGINAETAVSAHRAGADVLVAGSSVFGAQDRHAAIAALHAAAR